MVNHDQIRTEQLQGESYAAIAKRHGVSRQYIYQLARDVKPNHRRDNKHPNALKIAQLKASMHYFAEQLASLHAGNKPVVVTLTKRFCVQAIKDVAAMIAELEEDNSNGKRSPNSHLDPSDPK